MPRSNQKNPTRESLTARKKKLQSDLSKEVIKNGINTPRYKLLTAQLQKISTNREGQYRRSANKGKTPPSAKFSAVRRGERATSKAISTYGRSKDKTK